MFDRFDQRLCFFLMGKFGYEEHVCGTLHDCEYDVVVTVRNQIHFKIPKAFLCSITLNISNAHIYENNITKTQESCSTARRTFNSH